MPANLKSTRVTTRTSVCRYCGSSFQGDQQRVSLAMRLHLKMTHLGELGNALSLGETPSPSQAPLKPEAALAIATARCRSAAHPEEKTVVKMGLAGMVLYSK